MIPSVRMHVTSRNFGGPSILMSFPLHISGTHPQWLKWSCEAGGLPWRSQVGENPIPIPHPTNLVLFGHKITLYRSNQGAHTIALGFKSEQGAEPPGLPHFNHCPPPSVLPESSTLVQRRNRQFSKTTWSGERCRKRLFLRASITPTRGRMARLSWPGRLIITLRYYILSRLHFKVCTIC